MRATTFALSPVRTFALLAAPLLGVTSGLTAQPSGLTAGPQLAAVYDAIFDARFEQVPELLARTCGHNEGTPSPVIDGRAPVEACALLDTVTLLWQIQLDPNNRSLDRAFQARVEAAIAAVEAWTRRAPEQAEAWFYLGGGYGARAQWRVLRGERLAAARDGQRIKESLERALALDPGLQDAYFGIGLYHYYADVAPAPAKMLRWLLFLPAGDKTRGLQEMLHARSGGQLLRGEADYQLHLIYLWYEKQPVRALELLRALRERYPRNPHFQQRIAEVEDVYLHDWPASLRSWEELLESALARRVALPEMAEAHARLGIALQLDRLGDTDAALSHLRVIIDTKPESPYGAVAQAQLQLGQALDRVGARTGAIEAYRAALAAVPPGDALKIADRARAGLRAR